MNTSYSSRFSTFELFRIIIPGVYSTFLLSLLAISFEVPVYIFESTGLGVFFITLISLIAGLSFYAKETPKRRKAFKSNQPSIFILNRSRELTSSTPLTEDDARRIYFYILNHHMPVTVHDKIFFFGMIYHIFISIRRTSFWCGIIGFTGLLIQIALTSYLTPLSIISVLFIWVVYAINVRYNKADRKMQENYLDQIFWLEMNKDIVDKLIIHRVAASSDNERNLS